jgi:hypothetical protein
MIERILVDIGEARFWLMVKFGYQGMTDELGLINEKVCKEDTQAL